MYPLLVTILSSVRTSKFLVLAKLTITKEVLKVYPRAAKLDQAPQVILQVFLPYFQLNISYNFLGDGGGGDSLVIVTLILFESSFNYEECINTIKTH